MIHFDVNVPVWPKQADRSRIVRKRDGSTFVQHYQPQRLERNAMDLRRAFFPHAPDRPMEGPLRLSVSLHFPWRSSDPKYVREQGSMWNDTQPDVDNYAKPIMDALQSAGFFHNDGQVVDLRIRKLRSDKAPPKPYNPKAKKGGKMFPGPTRLVVSVIPCG